MVCTLTLMRLGRCISLSVVTFTVVGANHYEQAGAKQRGAPPAPPFGSMTEHTEPNAPTIPNMRPIFRSGPSQGWYPYGGEAARGFASRTDFLLGCQG